MAIVAIPVTLSGWEGGGAPGVNVWHARGDSAGPVGSFVDQLLWIEEYYNTISEAFHATVTINFAGDMFGVGPDEGNVYTGDPWTVAGSGGGDMLSPGLAILQKWRASTGGRSGRGRTFLGPLSEGLNQSNGTVTEDARDLIQGAAETLIESSDSFANGALGVWSPTDGVLRDFIDASVNNEFAFLRSRRD